MKNYFAHIILKYDTTTCRTMKDYCNETKRRTQQHERLKFLLTCRDYGIIPNHTRHTTNKVTQIFQCNKTLRKLDRILDKFHGKLLDLEISQTNVNITVINRKLHQIESYLQSNLTAEDYSSFIRKQNIRTKAMTTNIKKIQHKKIDTLKEKSLTKFGLNLNEHWFENRTEIEFPKECKWMLSLGKKFALPVNKRNFSPLHVIADVEQCIQNIDDEKEKEFCRTKIANRITNFKRNTKNTAKDKFITTIYKKTKKFLKNHSNIIIVQADKGNKTVAMYKAEYDEKMIKLLDDKTTYKTSRTDPTEKLRKTNNNIVTDLFKNEHINAREKHFLLSSAANAPRIYGLPKVHKQNVPLRPIVSSFNIPCYHLSKHIGHILQHLISTSYNIKNSMQLKQSMKNINLGDDEIIVSFDVISLFTNIPIQTAIRIIIRHWDKVKIHTTIPKAQFLHILKFCLIDNNYFIFDKTIYTQVFGMPMGNPLSPTIADIVLDDLLDNTIADLKNKDINIKYIVKYVDDILAIIKTDDKDEILRTLNYYHGKLKFTIEVEENNKIAYLDTEIHHVENTIKFDWYQKKIASGRIINFNSTQPKSQIINTAKSLLYKIFTISDEQFHLKNINIATKLLINNSFPKKLIQDLIDETNLKIQHEKNKSTPNNDLQNDNIEIDKTKMFYSVQYIPGLTDSKTLKTTINDEKVCFAYKSNTTLSAIFSNIKTPIEKQQQHNLVYEIPCMGNEQEQCRQIYIGTTKRTLDVRIGEHKADIEKRRDNTALSQHILDTGHIPNFKRVKILDKEKKERKRFLMESLHIIQQQTRTLNVKNDTDNVSASYRVAIGDR